MRLMVFGAAAPGVMTPGRERGAGFPNASRLLSASWLPLRLSVEAQRIVSAMETRRAASLLLRHQQAACQHDNMMKLFGVL